MSYNGDKLSQVVSTIEGQGPSIWNYITADTLATVKGAGYFSDFVKRGGRLGDLIVVSIGTLNTAVYPASGASTADVGEGADFTAQPQTVITQVSSISTNAATVVGMSADLGTNVVIGDTPASTVGFYGVTPTAQASLVAAVVTTGVVTTGFGFATTTQGNALIAAVNSILADLKTFGLMATT